MENFTSHHPAGLSLTAGGRGFSRATLLENRRKVEPKEILSHLIPRLLVVFTWQLEILVTTLIRGPARPATSGMVLLYA